MTETRRFDYDAALRQLMDLRFAARANGQPLSEVGRWLERRIHAHVLYHADGAADGAAGDAGPTEKAA